MCCPTGERPRTGSEASLVALTWSPGQLEAQNLGDPGQPPLFSFDTLHPSCALDSAGGTGSLSIQPLFPPLTPFSTCSGHQKHIHYRRCVKQNPFSLLELVSARKTGWEGNSVRVLIPLLGSGLETRQQAFCAVPCGSCSQGSR